MDRVRASNRNFGCVSEEQSRGIKYVKDVIQDLENYGPAGLIHIMVLSYILERPILIWNCDGSFNRIIGKEKKGCPINIEYHPADLGHTQIGHWTLKNGKDPADTTIYLNSCLFSVIGSQTGEDPSELRKTSILKLKRIPQELAYRMNEIIRLEGNDGIMLMIGGARYNGRSPIDAGRILDKSQNVVAHGYREVGHPRGHASDPNAVGSISSVENYAKSSRSRKTGFLSRCDQNMVAHLALISEEAKGDMNYLNTGDTNNVVSRITNNVLKQLADRYLYNLPQAQWYNADGTPTKNPRDILRVTLILRHHAGQEKNAEADVFVQTFYPEI